MLIAAKYRNATMTSPSAHSRCRPSLSSAGAEPLERRYTTRPHHVTTANATPVIASTIG